MERIESHAEVEPEARREVEVKMVTTKPEMETTIMEIIEESVELSVVHNVSSSANLAAHAHAATK